METVIRELKRMKKRIPRQTYRTIIGQIRSGDMEGAATGVERIKNRLKREDAVYGRKDTGN